MPDVRRHPAYAGLKRFRAGWLALLAATVIALYLCWLMLRPFVEVLLWATVLVIIFYPAHHDLLRRTQRPSLSAITSCILVAITLLLPLTLLAIVVGYEAADAAQYLQDPENYKRLLDPEKPHVQWLDQYVVEVDRFRSPEGIRDAVASVAEALGEYTPGIVGGVLVTVLKIFFVVFTMYYLFRDAERVQVAMRDMLPLHPSQSQQIFDRTREVINASVYGVLVIAILQGTLGGLAFWFLGLPSPLLWGAVMTLLSMIPLIGSTVVWIPTAGYLALTGSWGKALFLVFWGAVVIASVDNFLRPRLVGGKTRLHELLVFFSVVGGLQVFGILGIVVGPVVVAITLALLEVFRKADRPPQVTAAEPTLAEIQSNVRQVPPERPAGEEGASDKRESAAPAGAATQPPDGEGGSEGAAGRQPTAV